MPTEQIERLLEFNAEAMDGQSFRSQDGMNFYKVAGRDPSKPLFGHEAVRVAGPKGITLLKSQYNSDVGLLEESPRIGKHNYYLTNDNALAAYTLAVLKERNLADNLRSSLRKYGYQGNGFIEVAWGVPVKWPPNHHKDVVVAQVGEDRVIQETHEGPGYFYDWSAYSNLVFMGALNEYNQGFRESALRLYEIEMSTFDGVGWKDKAYWDRGGVYETIGLAWALYVGVKIGAPVRPELATALLQKQGPAGGFHTHYKAANELLADPNVETTCLSLLALDAYFSNR